MAYTCVIDSALLLNTRSGKTQSVIFSSKSVRKQSCRRLLSPAASSSFPLLCLYSFLACVWTSLLSRSLDERQAALSRNVCSSFKNPVFCDNLDGRTDRRAAAKSLLYDTPTRGRGRDQQRYQPRISCRLAFAKAVVPLLLWARLAAGIGRRQGVCVCGCCFFRFGGCIRDA